jgi:hypothetical protein
MTNNNFWVIFDTCTRPEYYLDVHNILALPYGSIVRYNYNKKYLDNLSSQYLDQDPDQFPKSVLLIYGEFIGYQKGDTHEKFKELQKNNSDFVKIPTRLCELKNIQKINEEVYFDLELKEYPYPLNENILNEILKSLDNSTPFSKGNYIAISGNIQHLNFLQSNGNEKKNWSAIVKQFQDKTQFKEDSFWRIEGPFKKNGVKIKPKITYNKESKSSYLNHFVITEGTEFYFNLYNYEPKNNKYQAIIEKVKAGHSYDDYLRKVLIDDTSSPVIAFIKEIQLRQYFISKIKFQRNFNQDLLTKEGACYFKTLGKVDYWPIGPDFYLYFQLKKNPYLLILAIISILVAVAFAIKSKYSIDNDLINCAIFQALISTLGFIAASFIIYRQIKTKI